MKLFLLSLILLPVATADPLIFNWILKCDTKHIRHWCAEIFVWEEDSTTLNDPLAYSRVCSYSKEIFISVPTKPGGDGPAWGLFQNYYEVNYQIYTTCHPHNRTNITSPKDKCKCYTSTGYEVVPSKEEVNINKIYRFRPKGGIKLSDERCTIPIAFLNLDRYYMNARFTKDSPCSFSFRDEETAHHLQWQGTQDYWVNSQYQILKEM